MLNMVSNRYAAWKKNCSDNKDIGAKILQSLQHTVMILLQHPLTFRNIIAFVAEAQRAFLDIYAFLEFIEVIMPRLAHPSVSHPVWSDWMGCFTQDTAVCDKLFHAGVPVWLIRPKFAIMKQTIIERLVKYSFPDKIVQAMYSECSKSVPPFDLLYRGPGGLSRHINSCHYCKGTTHPGTPNTNNLSSEGTSQVGKAPTQSQMRKADQKQHSRPPQTQQSK